MSTKIHNGVYFIQSPFIEDVLNGIDIFRWKKLPKLVKKFELDWFTDRVVASLDSEGPGDHMASVYKEWLDERDERKRGIYTSSDVDFSVVVYGDMGEIYGQIFTERKEFQDAFEKLLKPDDFSYYDNTDRPDDVSAAEWRNRKSVWNRILFHKRGPGYGVPTMRGITIECIDTKYRMPDVSVEGILKNFPSFDARVDKKARDVCHFIKMKELQGTEDFSFRFMFDASEWLKTEEGKDAVAMRVENFRKTLIADPTVEDINGPKA